MNATLGCCLPARHVPYCADKTMSVLACDPATCLRTVESCSTYCSSEDGLCGWSVTIILTWITAIVFLLAGLLLAVMLGTHGGGCWTRRGAVQDSEQAAAEPLDSNDVNVSLDDSQEMEDED